MPAFVSLESVDYSYRPGTPVFKGVTCQLLNGRVTGLLGPSGSGKSTLLRLIAGVARPQRGSITLGSPNALVAYVSQDPVLFEQYSRRENARYRERRGRFRARFSEIHFRRIAEVLTLDENFLNLRRPFEPVSGGQRQRILLLRELSILPDLLLLDEPCTGLDAGVKRDFLVLLRQILDELEIRCLYATHHFDEVRLIGDEVVYLDSVPPLSLRPQARPIGTFITSPPTIDAALALVGSLASTLRVARVGAEDFVPRGLGVGSTHSLVFSEQGVQSADRGFDAKGEAHAGCASIVSVLDQTIIVGGSTRPLHGKVVFSGPAFLFSQNAIQGRFRMDTFQTGNEWAIRLSPLS